eukprot:1665577-Ditylum_brightwellii.AAC.1
MAVYGDTIHRNDGTHLAGGVAEDTKWQQRWQKLARRPQNWYSVLAGPVGMRFVSLYAAEWRGVRGRAWNSERPLVFAAVVLQTAPG